MNSTNRFSSASLDMSKMRQVMDLSYGSLGPRQTWLAPERLLRRRFPNAPHVPFAEAGGLKLQFRTVVRMPWHSKVKAKIPAGFLSSI